MLESIRIKLLLVVLMAIGTWLPAMASLNLYLDAGTVNQMGVSQDETDLSQYMLVTNGNDPFVYTTPTSRALTSDETILSFEYCSTGTIDHFEVFFGYPAVAGKSVRFSAISQQAGWTTYSVDLADAMNSFSWGNVAGQRLRLDFGSTTGIGMFVRHIHIHKATDDPWVDSNENVLSEENIKAAGLPIVEIITIDNEEPSFEQVMAPEGSIGAGITNATKVPGSVRVIAADGTVTYDSGEYVKKTSGMTVKVRGNTSAYTLKKPYKIKLEKKGDLLGRGNKKYNDKNWVLLKDESQLVRNGFKVNELMGMQWTPQCQFVNVMFNGEYRGMYLLAEAVERNNDCRLTVDDTGFIVERDPYWWNEDGCYVASTLSPIYNYTFKYPDFEDMTNAELEYVENTMITFENSVAQGTYDKYIDTDTFARWLLAHDILGTYDSGGSNMYFTKYDNTNQSLIMMGNLWDFDSTQRCADAWSNLHIHTFPNYFYPNNPNPLFSQLYFDNWERVRGSIFNDMIDFINNYANSDEGIAFGTSNRLDAIRWGTSNPSQSEAAASSVAWYSSRSQWLANAISVLSTSTPTVGVDGVTLNISVAGKVISVAGLDDTEPIIVADMQGRVIYNGVGRRVELPAAGLYIVAAKGSSAKVIIR